MHFKIILNFIFLFELINSITCWPVFQFYNKNSQTNSAIISAQNITQSGFSFSKETKILIHGFSSDGDKSTIAKMKDELLIKNDVNVVVVNWEKGSAPPDYFRAAKNSKIVGSQLGKFILESKINPATVHCIGHSLGAHACGFAGKETKLNRISGLDPAGKILKYLTFSFLDCGYIKKILKGPLFFGKQKQDRLDKTDAEFVDVIHTDKTLGIQQRIGHKDFYPNGGQVQNGCNIFRSLNESEIISIRLDSKLNPVNLIACSHLKVTLFYLESINSNCKFTAVPCENYNDFKYGKCVCNPQFGCSSMGFRADETKEEGVFYLKTNSKEPHCLN